MRGLSGKAAIVTGGARGIGRAVAARLAEEGMSVMIADIEDEAGEKTAAELGDTVLFTECDVAEKLDVRNLLAATLDAFGDVHVLVNNAGIVGGAPFLELSEEDFDRVLAVNLKGAFLVSQAVAKHMVERVKAGGPGGATDSVTSFIFREYRDRSNVGYGTMLAFVYLVLIVIGFTLFIKLVSRWMRPQY